MDPVELEVDDGEAADDAPEVDPGGGEGGVVREAVEDVGRDGRHATQSCEGGHALLYES